MLNDIINIPAPSTDFSTYTVLVVDDNTSQRMTAVHFLRQHMNINAEAFASGSETLARLADMSRPTADLVLLDFFMPIMDGRATLQRIREHSSTLPVIILTANDVLEDAVALMKEGANDFVTKPFNAERLRLSVEQHLTIRTLRNEVARLRRSKEGHSNFEDIIGAEDGLAATITLARKAALSNINVLLSGESGTGKELVARAIHGQSIRSGKPFIAVNCGAIPETLAESTLFGHEKGSFTGAIAREPGKFREADGGTLFLDEVGELKPEMQTKLLRALQTGEIEPVGASKSTVVDVRIISATHRNLAQDIKTGRFREDLYYRLNVLPITLPPLRARICDIPALTLHILARLCASEHKPAMTVTASGMQWLKEQPWHGNVRELENLLYRAVVLSNRQILDETDFAAMTHGELMEHSLIHGEAVPLFDETGRARTWDEMEAHIIASILKRCGGHVSKAAKMLGMGQSTLYKKLTGKVIPLN